MLCLLSGIFRIMEGMMFKNGSPWWLPLVGFVLLMGSVLVGNLGGEVLHGASFFAGLMDGVALAAFAVFIYAGRQTAQKQPVKRPHRRSASH
jgi:hypothetical protein